MIGEFGRADALAQTAGLPLGNARRYNSLEMVSRNGAGVRVNSFALVSYLPDPLATFLDGLRNDLVPGCHARAHVTLLPPRALSVSPGIAWAAIQERLLDFQPFLLELGEIEIFPVTQVIYISIKFAQEDLKLIHSVLNSGVLYYEEPFEYHPHLTLAQELEPDEVASAAVVARRRWANFPHPKSFTVDRLTFVQNTSENQWMDLSECDLSSRVTI